MRGEEEKDNPPHPPKKKKKNPVEYHGPAIPNLNGFNSSN